MTKEDMIDGDKFDRLSQDLGLVYIETHDLTDRIDNVKLLSGQVNILSHNSDGCIIHRDGSMQPRSWDFVWDDIPPSVGCWFGQNIDVRDPRLVPIPIGLERDRWHPPSEKKDIILRTPVPSVREGLLYLNVSERTHHSRQGLYQMFADSSWCTSEAHVDFCHFAEQLSTHKFTLSPDGNGSDTHRTWEALYLGSFPIVRRHCFTEEFAKQLPLLIVDDWSEVTEVFLSRKYQEFMATDWNWSALRIQYWRDLICQLIS